MDDTKKLYKSVCISMRDRDSAKLDAKVNILRQKGHAGVSRSSVIRWALRLTKIEDYPEDL